MNRKCLVTMLLASCSMMAWAQTQWSLKDCIDYALANNIQVKQAELNVQSAEVDKKQNFAALFPSLTFSSSQQLGFQSESTQSYSSFDADIKNPTYNGSYNLQASVTLYDGGANYRNVKKSRLDHQASILSAEQTANNVEVQIIQAYYQILYAHESVLTDEEIVEVAKQELDRATAKLEVGKCSKVDVAQMESQYQSNLYQLTNAKNQEAANVLSLKQLLQLPTSADFNVDLASFSTDDVMRLLAPVAEEEQMALANLPDVKAAELNLESARLNEKIARGGYAPTISLSAGVSTGNANTYQGSFGTQLGDHMRESIGLSLNVPIYDNRRTRSSVDKAKIQTSNSLFSVEDTRLQVCNTIASLHLDIESAQSRYTSAVASEVAAKESYDVMSERFNVGLESLIDLLNEKNKYLQARQETLQSKFTALLNLRLMDFYTGRE